MAGEIDHEERTNALGLFNTARSYWHSAEHLNVTRLKLTHPQAPVRFLFCHAIELYLKAYLRAGVCSLAELKKIGHRVDELANVAAQSGLVIEPADVEILSHIHDADVAIEARYIRTGFKELPTDAALSSVSAHLDQLVCTALADKGIPVRKEKFNPPPASQSPDELGSDTHRVLVYLFQTDEMEDRDVRVAARSLGITKPMLQYHLDLLDEAKLAECTGYNTLSGAVFWATTPKGRRYVVERHLHEPNA
ncbi:MAG TPA: hypothetical protein VK430_09215 [Xanthobacteraceae bacterium]|nr:hypothetical protein [Xanthobacteraceae bacterium]